MIVFREGEEIHGPDGQYYKVLSDVHNYDYPRSDTFEAHNGAPQPSSGVDVPDWMVVAARDRILEGRTLV